MLKIFTSGLMANLVFVGTGLAKQYLVASSLPVTDFGTYGSLVAIASLMIVLIPFPNYLAIMIQGFSAGPRAFGTRKRLIIAARHELLSLAALCGVSMLALGLYTLLNQAPDKRAFALILLLIAQFTMACIDLLLRMQQAHGRLAAL